MLGVSSFAQVLEEDTSHNEPFFKFNKFDSKCNLGIEGTATYILRKQAVMNLGFNFNWVINHKYVVIAKYHVLTSPVDVQPIVAPEFPDEVINLSHNYGGLGFGYVLFHDKAFSLEPELTAGWANVKYKVEHALYRKNFAMIIPAFSAIYNCSKYFRFGLGVNYQGAAGCKSNGLKDADLSSFGGYLFMRIGTF